MSRKPSRLFEKLRQKIEAEGSIPVDQWMYACLQDPCGGYYTTGKPFGRGGDFVTAPEISQMFGELLGIWAAAAWQSMGSPDEVQLIELGPGRGTLMSDALRAIKAVPDFMKALRIHLIETSDTLRDTQRSTLSDHLGIIEWHSDLGDIPAGKSIIVANEFLDALPIQQLVYQGGDWFERVVTWKEEKFAFTLGDKVDAGVIPNFDNIPEDALFETSPAVDAVVSKISRRLSAEGGCALLIDYGHAERGLGETLQAVRNHAYADPLDRPGEQDLTAHVDFAAVAESAEKAGASVWGPVTQAELLEHLGIGARTTVLLSNASAKQREQIGSARRRLTDTSAPESMGRLFKAIAIGQPSLPTPFGFAPQR